MAHAAIKTDESASAESKLVALFRVGKWQCAIACGLLLLIAYSRMPLREHPDALFVSDGFGYYAYLPSLIIDRDLDFTNQFARIPYEGSKAYFQTVEKTGLRGNPFPPGPAILWSPFFLGAHAACSTLNKMGFQVPTNGAGLAYELPVYCGAFLYGLAGMWIIERLLLQLFPEKTARYSLVLMLFCTPLAYYLWIEPNMPHVTGLFTLALFVYQLFLIGRYRDQRALSWVLLGVALGAVALVRPYNGVIAVAVPPVAWHACRAVQKTTLNAIIRASALTAMTATASLVVFTPHIILTTLLYGEIVLTPPRSGYEKLTWLRPDIWRYAVSVYSYAPILVVATWGLIPLGIRPRREPVRRNHSATEIAPEIHRFLVISRPFFLFAIIVVSYVVAAFPKWIMGESFGQRRMVDWSPVFAIGLAIVLDRYSNPHQSKWLVKIAILLVVCHAVLMGLYIAKRLPEWGLATYI